MILPTSDLSNKGLSPSIDQVRDSAKNSFMGRLFQVSQYVPILGAIEGIVSAILKRFSDQFLSKIDDPVQQRIFTQITVKSNNRLLVEIVLGMIGLNVFLAPYDIFEAKKLGKMEKECNELQEKLDVPEKTLLNEHLEVIQKISALHDKLIKEIPDSVDKRDLLHKLVDLQGAFTNKFDNRTSWQATEPAESTAISTEAPKTVLAINDSTDEKPAPVPKPSEKRFLGTAKAKGSPGKTGAKGSPGITGTKGSTGATGVTGASNKSSSVLQKITQTNSFDLKKILEVVTPEELKEELTSLPHELLQKMSDTLEHSIFAKFDDKGLRDALSAGPFDKKDIRQNLNKFFYEDVCRLLGMKTTEDQVRRVYPIIYFLMDSVFPFKHPRESLYEKARIILAAKIEKPLTLPPYNE